jgi:hypothetical protein
MQQVVVIGGGDTFDTHDEYLVALRGRVLTLDRLKGKGWKSTLETSLGEGYEVLSLRMPCMDNAKYLEWKIVFEKLLPLLSGKTVFIGHSLAVTPPFGKLYADFPFKSGAFSALGFSSFGFTALAFATLNHVVILQMGRRLPMFSPRNLA